MSAMIIRYLKIMLLFATVMALSLSCREKKTDFAQKQGLYDVEEQSGCVACHTNKSLLAEVAEPLSDGGGEAGEG
ncbi:MAG: hypothetical protein GXO77_16320 [Calditrichaeota bacterium]|nr:hypothetical protein [Calditrichota bacterium]